MLSHLQSTNCIAVVAGVTLTSCPIMAVSQETKTALEPCSSSIRKARAYVLMWMPAERQWRDELDVHNCMAAADSVVVLF